ncbi:MAG: class I SAM-dependent methyltransferase [Candidatus Omnitrophica bacterium]|nr:class I SAM-dependent methyltransferase [Candidatus Omnitrophota bacterium]
MLIMSPLFIVKNLERSALKRYSDYLSGRVLDIGCGTRPYERYLKKSSEYIGMDESSDVKPDILGSIRDIPFPDGHFDAILCTEVLEHLAEPEIAIKEIKRVLKKEGYLYMTVPQEWCLHYEPDDYFRFTKYGIRYLLEKNGLQIIAIDRIGGIFSLIGQRFIDVAWSVITGLLRPVIGLKWAERTASILCLPVSLSFFILSMVGDNIDKKDALGWAVLAVK